MNGLRGRNINILVVKLSHLVSYSVFVSTDCRDWQVYGTKAPWHIEGVGHTRGGCATRPSGIRSLVWLCDLQTLNDTSHSLLHATKRDRIITIRQSYDTTSLAVGHRPVCAGATRHAIVSLLVLPIINVSYRDFDARNEYFGFPLATSTVSEARERLKSCWDMEAVQWERL